MELEGIGEGADSLMETISLLTIEIAPLYLAIALSKNRGRYVAENGAGDPAGGRA
jgi:hypothetical protein